MDEIWRVENGNAFIDARHPLEENDCSTAGTMIIPLDRGDWQGIKRAPPDSAAFSLRGPPHYPRVDRVEINGNDDNCPPPPPPPSINAPYEATIKFSLRRPFSLRERERKEHSVYNEILR